MINSLDDLHILALDCQTTGANPDNGHLLEIGWVKARVSTLEKSEDLQPLAYLVKLPAKDEIPRRVKRITGIMGEDLRAAYTPKRIWHKLVKAGQDVTAGSPSDKCPTVIHFSRFEEPFLRDLHQKWHSLRICSGKRLPT